jgi:hypothetical protein
VTGRVLAVTGTEVVVVPLAAVVVLLVVLPVVWPAFVVGGTVVDVTPVKLGPGTSIMIDL